jgi:hypothetical protein
MQILIKKVTNKTYVWKYVVIVAKASTYDYLTFLASVHLSKGRSRQRYLCGRLHYSQQRTIRIRDTAYVDSKPEYRLGFLHICSFLPMLEGK